MHGYISAFEKDLSLVVMIGKMKMGRGYVRLIEIVREHYDPLSSSHTRAHTLFWAPLRTIDFHLRMRGTRS